MVLTFDSSRLLAQALISLDLSLIVIDGFSPLCFIFVFFSLLYKQICMIGSFIFLFSVEFEVVCMGMAEPDRRVRERPIEGQIVHLYKLNSLPTK